MQLPVRYEGLSPSQRQAVRAEYIKRQDGKCAHCGEDIHGQPAKRIRDRTVNNRLFPPNFFKWPQHLHHCHDSGMTIGVVHARCNAVLWQYYGQ